MFMTSHRRCRTAGAGSWAWPRPLAVRPAGRPEALLCLHLPLVLRVVRHPHFVLSAARLASPARYRFTARLLSGSCQTFSLPV